MVNCEGEVQQVDEFCEELGFRKKGIWRKEIGKSDSTKNVTLRRGRLVG
jgi:hypothetical protein